LVAARKQRLDRKREQRESPTYRRHQGHQQRHREYVFIEYINAGPTIISPLKDRRCTRHQSRRFYVLIELETEASASARRNHFANRTQYRATC